MGEDLFDVPAEPVIVHDADEAPQENAQGEFQGEYQGAGENEYSEDDPVGDFKPLLERVFSGEIHFLYS